MTHCSHGPAVCPPPMLLCLHAKFNALHSCQSHASEATDQRRLGIVCVLQRHAKKHIYYTTPLCVCVLQRYAYILHSTPERSLCHAGTDVRRTIDTPQLDLSVICTRHNQGQCRMESSPVDPSVMTFKYILDHSIASSKEVSVHLQA